MSRRSAGYLRFGNRRCIADKVGTPERLKMLCLFTYADIKAVNPDALTPGKLRMSGNCTFPPRTN